MSSGRIQLLLKGVEDGYVTGSPQITYFRTLFNSVRPFEIRYNENQFYSYGVAFGGSQYCLIKYSGDIVRSNFLKIKLPSLFIRTFGWCYPDEAKDFNPDVYILDENFKFLNQLSVKDTVIYYNTKQLSWIPYGVTLVEDNVGVRFKFKFENQCRYIAFRNLEDAVFWGFKNYNTSLTYTKFKNSFYVFEYTSGMVSEYTLEDSGWVNSFMKYLRKYKDSVGSIFIDRLELYIGSQLVENIDGQYMSIYKDLQVPEQLQESLNYLEGAVAPPSTSDSVYYVYLPFSFKNIPVCALARQELEIRVYFKTFEDIVPSEYLNIKQFSIDKTMNIAPTFGIFDGTTKYYMSSKTINEIPLSEEIIPSSTKRSMSNLYILTKTSNILKFDTITMTEQTFDCSRASEIKKSIGLFFTNSLLSATNNGIFQRLSTNSLLEYTIDKTGIVSVHYFNSLFFVSTSDYLYVYTNDFRLRSTRIIEPILYSVQNTTTLFLISNARVYAFDYTLRILVNKTPEESPVGAWITPASIYIKYKSGKIYTVSTISGTFFPVSVGLDPTTIVTFNSSIFFSGNFSNIYYKLDYSSDIALTSFSTSNAFINGITFGNKALWVSNNSTIASGTLGSIGSSIPLVDFNEKHLPISSNVIMTKNKRYVFTLDDTNKLYQIDIDSLVATPIIINKLTGIEPKTIAYDGTKIYMFPSNGTSNLIIHDTTQTFNDPRSYTFVPMLDSTTNQPKSTYVLSSEYDGTIVYGCPDKRDGNVISYNTNEKVYSFIDFIKYGKDYSLQDITHSIIVDTDMYMLYSNGFFRYDTRYIDKPYETRSGNLAFALDPGIMGIFSDSTSSNVFFLSNNIGQNGYYQVSTNTEGPKATGYADFGFLRGNIYTSYQEYGSNVYMVPKLGNAFVSVPIIDPFLLTPIVSNYPPNGSSTSVIINDKIYAFPGSTSSNTVVLNVTYGNTYTITTLPNDYVSSIYDGRKYVYLTSSDASITRFNTTLDVFNDFSGYSSISANAIIRTTDVITQNGSQVYFSGNSNLIVYDALSNTYTDIPYKSPDKTVAAATTTGGVYILTSNGTVRDVSTTSIDYDIGNRNYVGGLKPIDIMYTQNKIYTTFSNTIGILDRTSMNGLGYYTSNIVNRPNPTPPVNTFLFNNSIVSVYSNTSISKFNPISNTYTFSNINSSSQYRNHLVYKSNLYMIPTSGNVLYRDLNMKKYNLSVPNISSASNTDAYIYMISSTANTFVQFDPVAETFMYFSNGISNCISTYNYNNFIYMFSKDSNTVSYYNTYTQNFNNLDDSLVNAKLLLPNIISTFANTCMTDQLRIFSISDDNTVGQTSVYAGTILQNNRQGYIENFNGGRTTVFSKKIIVHTYTTSVITDLYFDQVGTWIVDGTQYDVQSIGEVRKSVRLTRTYTYVRPGGIPGDSDIFYVPDGNPDDIYVLDQSPLSYFNDIIPDISSGYLATTDAKLLANVMSYKVYGEHQTTDAQLNLYGTVSLQLSSATITFIESGSNVISFDMYYELIDDAVAQLTRDLRLTNTSTLVVKSIATGTKNLYMFINNPNNFGISVKYNNQSISRADAVPPTPGIQFTDAYYISFTANTPVPVKFRFNNVYSTNRYTYLFNENPMYKTGNLIVYKNETSYSTPIRSFPLVNKNIGNIDAMIHQGVPPIVTMYMITDNYSNLWRFNEQYDSSGYTNIRFTNSLKANLQNAHMFSLSDGICILTGNTIYSVGIQDTYTNVQPYTMLSTVKYANSVYIFTNSNTIIKSNLQKISDIGKPESYKAYTFSNEQYPGFKNAYYDGSKYMILAVSGNVMTFNASSFGTGQVANPVQYKNVPWMFKEVGIVSKYLSYLPSINTDDAILAYIDGSSRTYKTLTYNIPSIDPLRVQVYSNTAYILPTDPLRPIVSLDMTTNRFDYLPTMTPNTPSYYQPGFTVSTTHVNKFKYTDNTDTFSGASFDGRYIVITKASNIFNYDTVSNSLVVYNNGAIFDSSQKYFSNIYFSSPNGVLKFDYSRRSYNYIKTSNNFDCLNYETLAEIFMTSTNGIYKLVNDTSLRFVAPSPTSNSKVALDVNGSNVAIAYDDSIVILDRTAGVVNPTTYKVPPYESILYDNGTFYMSNATSISRLTNGVLTTNSEFEFIQDYTLGPNFMYNANLYTLTSTNRFLLYNQNNVPFVSTSLPYFGKVYTSRLDGDSIYFAPGDGTTIWILDTYKSFHKPESYIRKPIPYQTAQDYRSSVEFGNQIYFVPRNTSNLITISGTDSMYQMTSGSSTSLYTRGAVYTANSTHVNKLYTVRLASMQDYKNKISFSTPTFIKDVVYDGRYLYTIGDFIYKLDTVETSVDLSYVLQDTDEGILTRDDYASGFFDGRFINLLSGNSSYLYDTIPLNYPEVFSPSILTEYVYISDDERALLQTRSLQYMIKQIQKVVLPTNGYFKVNFLNLLSEVIAKVDTGTLKRMAMYLNGHEKFDVDGEYMSTIQIHNYHSRRPTVNNLYTYSFCSNPEDDFPDGHINASRIIDKVFYCQTSEPTNVSLYGITHNIFKFKDGLGGLVFNNSTN
jgi:hypothetical protein